MSCISDPENPELDEIKGEDEGWPEEGSVFIKKTFEGSDDATITDLTLHARFITDLNDEEKQNMETDVNLGKTKVATAAVMCRRLEGPYFTDPVTGQPMVFRGKLQDRLDTAGRLPVHVLKAIDVRVKENSADPLGVTKKPKTDSSKKSSGR